MNSNNINDNDNGKDDQNVLCDSIYQRRSIRKYKKEGISGEILEKILDAARVAPSGKNRQPWKFLVYGGEEKKEILKKMRAGVFVGSVQKGRFVPEHHLFTAFGALCQNREELTLADSRTVEYLSGREIEAHTAADGWCCVTVDGWPLGGGKVSGGRVKNHYPKALRLL